MAYFVGIVLVFGLFTALFAGLIWSRYKWKLSLEWCRKIAHVGMGLACLPFPLFISTYWQALSLSIIFSGLLVLLRLEKKIFWGGGEILASSRCHSEGEFYFVAGVTFAFLFSHKDMFVYASSILILTFADTAAAVIGRWIGKSHFWRNDKTLEGSLAFFLVGFLCSLLSSLVTKQSGGLLMMVTTCLLATVVEGIAKRGSDNLLIPIVCVVGLLLPLWLPRAVCVAVIFSLSAAVLVWVHLKKLRTFFGDGDSRSSRCVDNQSECVSLRATLPPQHLSERDEAL